VTLGSKPLRVSEPQLRKKRSPATLRVLGTLALWGVMILLVGGGTAYYGYQEFTAAGPLAADKVFEIPRGLGTADIAAGLESAGIISDQRIFSAAAYLTGARGRLKAGEYQFKAGSSIREVMNLLESGKSITYKLSIPEGFTSDMVLTRINENDVLTGEVTGPVAEGSIMPDTYLFKRGMTRQKLLSDMEAAETKLLAETWAKRRPGLPLSTPEEAVILASIVEKETAVDGERPLIASVFLNRLKKGMRLQSDPTIIYGIVGGKGRLDHKLTKTDITTPTPYNTYTIDGLPPGPIANPGRAALEAVLNPPDTSYLYFVADGTGGHAFASTLEEHNRNVAKWRDIDGNAAIAVASEAESATAAAQSTAAAANTLPAITEEKQPAGTDTTTASAGDAASAATPVQTSEQTTDNAGSATTQPVVKVAEAQPAEPKPGSVIKLADRLIPIPRRKPRH
jgi:UPF0755 protein